MEHIIETILNYVEPDGEITGDSLLKQDCGLTSFDTVSLYGELTREYGVPENLPALRRAVGMTGEVCLHTFEQEAVRSGGAVLALEDHYGVAYRVTRTLFERSRAVGHEVYVSYDPIHPHKIDGLYYPDGGLCILVGDVDTAAVTEAGIPLRSIPLRRFLHAEPFREIRGDLRRACAECNRLTEAALEELSSAAKFHFELEGIYSEAMNFKAKEAFTEQFCNDLFAE